MQTTTTATTATRMEQLEQHRSALASLKETIIKASTEYNARNMAFNAWLQAELGLDVKNNEEMHLTDILAKWSTVDSKLIV